MAHREKVASSHNNPRGTIMTFPTRFAASATSNDSGEKSAPSQSQEPQTQQQKDDAARKQAQKDPNKQVTPQ